MIEEFAGVAKILGSLLVSFIGGMVFFWLLFNHPFLFVLLAFMGLL